MTKKNLTDTCLCGSGKQYQHCCGISNVVGMNTDVYNEELGDLHRNLVTYALTNFGDVLAQQAEQRGDINTADESDFVDQTYLHGAALWTIFHVPISKGAKTIFDLFFSQQKSNIKRTRTKNTFTSWAHTLPAVYEVTAMDTDEAIVKDILTNQTYTVPAEETVFDKGSLLIGVLVPFVGHHRFFYNIIRIYNQNTDDVLALQADYLNEDKQLNDQFADFLLDVLRRDEHVAWEQPIYEEVAESLLENLTRKGFPEDKIVIVIFMWYDFCQKHQPNIRNSAPHAAALEYFFHTSVVENNEMTQREIADEYGTTPGSISVNYRRLVASIEEDALEGPLELAELMPEQEQPVVIDADVRAAAEQLLVDAEATTGAERTKLIESSLAMYPGQPHGYLLLAEEAEDDELFADLLLKAIEAGERDLGEAFFTKNTGNFFVLPETRPYMQALALYINFLFGSGEAAATLAYAEQALRLNPTDHQGIRYVLLPVYIELGQPEQARTLMNTYDDRSTNFIFNSILIEYLMNGMTPLVRSRIRRANHHNRFVKDFLKGTKEITDYDHADISVGNEVDAMIYAESHHRIWQRCPEVLNLL